VSDPSGSPLQAICPTCHHRSNPLILVSGYLDRPLLAPDGRFWHARSSSYGWPRLCRWTWVRAGRADDGGCLRCVSRSTSRTSLAPRRQPQFQRWLRARSLHTTRYIIHYRHRHNQCSICQKISGVGVEAPRGRVWPGEGANGLCPLPRNFYFSFQNSAFW